MTEAIKKTGVKFGIILGAIGILINAAIYTIDPTLFVSIGTGLCILFLNIVILIVGVASAKKQLNGFISFKEAFTVYFIEILIGGLISTLFLVVIFNLIDPSLKDVLTEKTISMTVGWMEKAGTPTQDIKKVVEEMKNTDSFGPVKLFTSYLGSLIIYIIIGLIVAAAFKKTTTHEQ